MIDKVNIFKDCTFVQVNYGKEERRDNESGTTTLASLKQIIGKAIIPTTIALVGLGFTTGVLTCDISKLRCKFDLEKAKINLSSSVCLFCNKTEVHISDWNKRCPKCKEEQRLKDEEEKRAIGIRKRKPAAIIDVLYKNGIPTGQKVYVDKFGEEVENPGYDLKNDPRGYKKTGIGVNPRKTII